MTLIQTTALAALIGLTGCQMADPITPSVQVETTSRSNGPVVGVQGQTTPLHVGQTLSIALPSNGSTGYSWQIAPFDETVLTPGTPYGVEVIDPHKPGMVGVGGQTQWRFEAKAAGQVTLTFAYSRPWETGTPPAETARYTITVQ